MATLCNVGFISDDIENVPSRFKADVVGMKVSYLLIRPFRIPAAFPVVEGAPFSIEREVSFFFDVRCAGGRHHIAHFLVNMD
jgi:hypothetical protein